MNMGMLWENINIKIYDNFNKIYFGGSAPQCNDNSCLPSFIITFDNFVCYASELEFLRIQAL